MPNTSVRDWVSLPGPTAMQLILHRVDSAPNSRAVAAAVINIAHFSAMRDEGQRARVRRLGTSRSFTVQIGSVGTDLEEALSSIVEDAEDPAFVLEETLLSTANLEVESESRRRAWSTGRTASFKVRIKPRLWRRRIRVEATGNDHFDISSRGVRRRPRKPALPDRPASKQQQTRRSRRTKHPKPEGKQPGGQRAAGKR